MGARGRKRGRLGGLHLPEKAGSDGRRVSQPTGAFGKITPTPLHSLPLKSYTKHLARRKERGREGGGSQKLRRLHCRHHLRKKEGKKERKSMNAEKETGIGPRKAFSPPLPPSPSLPGDATREFEKIEL